MSRALRRHHYRRLQKKRQHYWSGTKYMTPRKLGMVVSTPHPCSCMGCGHQRYWFGPTIQERRVKRILGEVDV